MNTKKLTGPILLVGSPNFTADLRYVTGFSCPDPVVYLQRRREKYLVVSPLEFGRAKRVVKGITVVLPQDLEMEGKSRQTISGWVIGLLRKTRTKSVLVSPDFPLGLAGNLKRIGITVTVAEGSLFPQREVKRPDELLKIRASQRAAVKAMAAAVHTIAHCRVDDRGRLRLSRRILTSKMLRSVINKVLLDHDCTGQGTIVACGRQAADPHEQGSGPVYASQPVVIDIFPQSMSHGYWGDLTRTIVKGEASPALRKMYKAVKTAQKAALSSIRQGVTIGTVHKSAMNAIRGYGFKTDIAGGRPEGFIHSTGHGVGLEIHEAPHLCLSSRRLRRGSVITVEPGLYYRNLGGIRIEDMVVVTATGWEYVEKCANFFVV